METHEIRREYLNPELIPADASTIQERPAARFYYLATFRVDEIAPDLFGSLFDTPRTADAVILRRKMYATRAERDEMEREGKPRRLFVGPAYCRVIAYNGKPITTGDYPDELAALLDAIRQREKLEPVED